MTIILSPLAYFGNRTTHQDDLFNLIQVKIKKDGRFDSFYDLFSGSGSVGLYAMSVDVAETYYFNDLFSPLAQFWKSVRQDAEKLIQDYRQLLSLYLQAADRESFYAACLEKFNQTEGDNSALFAFIINHAQHGIPAMSIMDGKSVLISRLTEEVGELEVDTYFPDRVRSVSQLFEKRQVYFCSEDFQLFLPRISQRDFVMLDPPYPDMPDANQAPDNHIYQRNASASDLVWKIKTFIHALDNLQASYIMCYGVLGMDSENALCFSAAHVLRLSGDPDGQFKEYIEHVFISKSLIPYVLQVENLGQLQPCFHRIFETHAYQGLYKNGDKVAMVWDDNGKSSTITYHALNGASNRVARRLQQEGLTIHKSKSVVVTEECETLVAIYLERTPALIISMLAVMKAGGAYLPLDANPVSLSPKDCFDRIQASQAKYLITTDALLEGIRHIAGANSILSQLKILVVSRSDVLCSELTRLITDDSNLNLPISLNDLAYVMYTSGSTGSPKGVEVLHRGLPFAFSSHQNLLNIQSIDRVAQFGSIGFDASLMEIMIALGSGAALYLVDEKVYGDTQLLTKLLRDNRITIAIQTPDILQQLNPNDFPDLRSLFIVGDHFPKSLADAWLLTHIDGKIIHREIINGYGLTETTICTALASCAIDRPLTIGDAILGLELYLRPLHEDLDEKSVLAESHWIKSPARMVESKEDSEMALRKEPVQGVLYVTGPCLARGYWQRSDLTQKAFTTTTINHEEKRLYNTGDVGYYQPNGAITITGRRDRQVKIRGQRVELDQIEKVVKTLTTIVADVRATVHYLPSTERHLLPEKNIALYIVPQNGSLIMDSVTPSQQTVKQLIKIRDYLSDSVHSAMVPSLACMKFVDAEWLQSLPVPCIDTPVVEEANT